MQYVKSDQADGDALAEIRASAMKPSLETLGRYDESRVRSRFLDTFVPNETFKIMEHETLFGFYVVREKEDHHYLDHLYVSPEHQNKQLGRAVLERVIKAAKKQKLPVRLGALRGSRANAFYANYGFIKTHEDEFDLYYEFPVSNM